MTHAEHPFHYYRSPSEIREVQFSHRVRGLDEYEVAEFLDLLADQVHATDLELGRLREERDRLRHENDRLRADNERLASQPAARTSPESLPQAATLLMNAQRVADDLVEEAVRRTRDMLTVARAEKNAILRNAQEAAAAMLLEARDALPGGHASPRDPLRDPLGEPLSSREPLSSKDTRSSREPLSSRDTSSGMHLSPQRSWQLDGHAAV